MRARIQGRPLLLLVEDDRVTAKALGAILGKKGWDVVVAASVRDAIEALEKGCYGSVILDLMLPDGDGVSVLRLIKSKAPKTRVIVTTGSNDPARLAAVDDLGAEVVLHKPIDLKELEAHLEES